MIESFFVGPFLNRLGSAIKLYKFVRPTISTLLLNRGPPTVTRLIVTIIIFPVNRILRPRLKPHVCQEILEGVQPAIAHLDTATAITEVALVIGIGAALDHAIPSLKFRKVALAMSRSITISSHQFTGKATARPGF
jgi:hypothetical protein